MPWRDQSIPRDIQYATPLTTDTVTVTGGNIGVLVLQPAGTIAACTVNMPASPKDQQQLAITSTQIITTLTHNGNGATLNGALTTLAANDSAIYVYRLANTSWFRIS